MPKLFLGLDSSTQSLSSTLIDLDRGDILDQRSINFDAALPDYRTQNGVLPHQDPAVLHSPPLMWADALDLLFQQFKQQKLPLHDILAVSGSGQQHGSVYMTAKAVDTFRDMDLNGLLADNLARVLTRPTSPVWMDSSTAEECDEIRRALGGTQAVVSATGSDCFERFTGPQIRKFHKHEPGPYKQTGHIALVSSLMSSLMAGQISPIDVGDGAGMNLMDIAEFTWHPAALNATAPDLRQKLPPIAPSNTILGVVNPYFVFKYGINPACKAVVWSGDNPNSLVGTGLVQPGMIAISLGTSDTLFGPMADCHTDPSGEGHLFGSPAGGYMSLICFKNGSLAREKIKDAHGYDWDQFSRALRDTPPGNRGKLLLPWFAPEIVPRVSSPGVHRKNLAEDEADANCRAVVEAQMMSMRLHSAWMGQKPACIHASGGASANPDILRVMADVHRTPVYRQDSPDSASLGAALRAAQAWSNADWHEITPPFTHPNPHAKIEPDPEAADIYDSLLNDYAAFEKEALQAQK